MNAKTNKLILIVILVICSLVFGGEQVYRIDHAVVTYENISLEYAKAICRTVVAARTVVDQFGFSMPETVKISVKCDHKRRVRLFNDGEDRLYLTVRSEKDLWEPSKSGIFHIYGICHEIGHIAMYRLLRNRNWLTTAGAEGWAHYIGSRIVDRVYSLEKKLWPDPYDYGADGTKRLRRQLAQSGASDIVQGAGLWMELADIIGDKNIAVVFRAWSETNIDPSDPAVKLRRALLRVNDDPRLSEWWNKAEPIFISKWPKSRFTARTAKHNELSGQAIELAHDDGHQAAKKSIAGSGHAVRFRVQGDSWYLTSVQIYGSRYGYSIPPKEDFHIWLCEKDFKAIVDFPQPYSKFKRGQPKWINLPVEPTNLPSEFIICIGFNPTGTKGVFVGLDAEASGDSFTALPDKRIQKFTPGDWLIRVRIDQLKAFNALKPPE